METVQIIILSILLILQAINPFISMIEGAKHGNSDKVIEGLLRFMGLVITFFILFLFTIENNKMYKAQKTKEAIFYKAAYVSDNDTLYRRIK